MRKQTMTRGVTAPVRGALMAALLLGVGMSGARSLDAQMRGGARADAPPRVERMERMERGAMQRGSMQGRRMERGSVVPGSMGGRMPAPFERLLVMRDRLELSEEQVARIEALQLRAREEGDRHFDEAVTLRRDVRDGDLTLEDARNRRQELAAARRTARQAIGEEAHRILTEEQRSQLGEAMHRAGSRRPAEGRGIAGRRGARGIPGGR